MYVKKQNEPHAGQYGQIDPAKIEGSTFSPTLRALRDFVYRQLRALAPVDFREQMRECRSRGDLAIRKNFKVDRPLSSASLSYAAGIPLERVGMLHDVDLTRELVTSAENPESRATAAEVLKLARAMRRSFNRLPPIRSATIETHAVVSILKDFEASVQKLPIQSKRDLEPLRAAFHQAALSLGLYESCVHLEVARELIVTTLSASREVVKNITGRLPATTFAPDYCALNSLELTLNAQRYYTGETRLALNKETTEEHFAHALETVENLRFRGTLESVFQPGDHRTVPGHLMQAARRALVGNHLGCSHGFSSLSEQYCSSLSRISLSAINELCDRWRAAEGPDKTDVQRVRREYLCRGLFSIPGTAPQSCVRDVIAPFLKWSERHFDKLSDEDKLRLGQLLKNTAIALEALTIREMALTLSFGRPARTDDESAFGRIPASPPPIWTRMLERSETARLMLDLVPPDPYVDRYAIIPRTWGGWARGDEMRAWFATKYISTHPDTYSARTRDLFSGICSWMATYAKRYLAAIPKQEGSRAIWLTEYDCSEGAVLPREIEARFESLQHERVVARDSRESGFVVPESAEWLRRHVYDHDGFLITVTDGVLSSSLSSQLPTAMYVATCSQKNPSALLPKLQVLAKRYLETLPASVVEPSKKPFVSAEIVVATSDSGFYLRSYGVTAYQSLDEQFEFNVISRFANWDRVECLAICRPDSTAMTAHKRMGWIDTGAVYTDSNGTDFAIIHRTVLPMEVILGMKDI